GGTSPFNLSSLTRASDTCPSSRTVVATATTSATHPFVVGATVSIGGTPGPGETAYVGSFVIASKTANTFTFNLNTAPGCTDSTAGMTASVQGVSRDALIRWVRGADNVGDEA